MMNNSPKIFFGIPAIDRRIDFECARSLFSMIQFYGGQVCTLMGISDIALARNRIAHQFKKSDCEWLMWLDSDIIFSEEDWNILWQGQEDIVTATYARKIPGESPNEYGLGFTRVHRSVFEKIDKLTRDDGSEFVSQFYFGGEMHSAYFSTLVSGNSQWLSEDRTFFILCALAEINRRLERNCKLQHVGNFLYGYPDQINNCKFWTPPSGFTDKPDLGPI